MSEKGSGQFNLENEVEEAREKFAKDREEGGKYQVVRREKKHKDKSNRGVEDRERKGDAEETADNFKWKERAYEQLKAGKLPAGYKAEDVLMQADEGLASNSNSSSESEDNEIEIVDEFGRTRYVSRKEYYGTDGAVERPKDVISGDHIQHEAVLRRERAAKKDLEDTGQDAHFDSTWEVRDKGVGFYQFSQNEEERQRQMQELKDARLDTLEKVELGDKVKARRERYNADRREKILRQREASLRRMGEM